MVLVTVSCCSAQNSSNKCSLLLQLPKPYFPNMPFQASKSQPTLALKLLSMITFSFSGTFCKRLQKSTQNIFFGRIHLESWSIHTKERGILMMTKLKMHGDDAVRVTDWLICKLGHDRISDHEADT